MRATAFTLGLLALLATGCRTPRTPEQVHELVNEALASMKTHEAAGETIEAAVMARTIRYVDPDQPDVAAVIANEPVELFDRGLAGSNKRLRIKRDTGALRRVLLYIPDRILDILDIFSFDVHIGFGLYVNAHATRLFNFGAGGRAVGGIGWHYGRSLGVQSQGQGEFWAIGGAQAYAAALAGTSGAEAGFWSVTGIGLPRDELYQDYGDYWAVGAGVTALVVGVDVDIHLYQILDFLAGLVTLDPARDDFATTRGLDFSSRDEDLIADLGRVAVRKAELQAYRDWIGGQRDPSGAPSNPGEPAAMPAATPDDAAGAATDAAGATDPGDGGTDDG